LTKGKEPISRFLWKLPRVMAARSEISEVPLAIWRVSANGVITAAFVMGQISARMLTAEIQHRKFELSDMFSAYKVHELQGKMIGESSFREE
jgi:hypothetical protein